jgi:KaiC/GvpD/RAD55 family RecA-like ATPase
MCDLYATYPDSELAFNPDYENLLTAFTDHGLTTCDILTTPAVELAHTVGRSAVELRTFMALLTDEIARSVRFTFFDRATRARDRDRAITTGVAGLDELLAGGIRVGCVTEVAGEASVGKSHLMLQLAATVQLPPALGGLGKPAIYIETESGGPRTQRLQAILDGMNRKHGPGTVSAEHVQCYYCNDIEELLHVIKYQLPVLIEKLGAGILLLDSLAAFFRGDKNLANTLFRDTTALLRGLARKGLAVVVVNQVTDRFDETRNEGHFPSSLPSQASNSSQDNEILVYKTEAAYFEGTCRKKPALGLNWTNEIDARLLLKRWTEEVYYEPSDFNINDNASSSTTLQKLPEIFRSIQCVFSGWCKPGEVEFTIVNDGLVGIS